LYSSSIISNYGKKATSCNLADCHTGIFGPVPPIFFQPLTGRDSHERSDVLRIFCAVIDKAGIDIQDRYGGSIGRKVRFKKVLKKTFSSGIIY
jgi:hypothetical protein